MSPKKSGRSPGNPAGRHRPKPPQPPEDEGAGVVWIKTEPAIDGSGYVVTLEASDDIAVTLTPDGAFRHAQGILAAAHRAAYDAAVGRQMIHRFGLTLEHAYELIVMLRNDRPPLDAADTAPLRLEPGVNKDLKPFLALYVNGEHVGQWDVDQAEQHAIWVLSMVGAADLDSAYYRMLVGQQQIEESQARQAVDDLANYRQEL